MKTLSIVLMIVISIGNHLFCQDLYLWSGMHGDEKVFLNLDLNRRLYRLENAGAADNIASQMKSRSSLVSVEVKATGKNTFLLVDKDDAFASFPNSEKVKFHFNATS